MNVLLRTILAGITAMILFGATSILHADNPVSPSANSMQAKTGPVVTKRVGPRGVVRRAETANAQKISNSSNSIPAGGEGYRLDSDNSSAEMRAMPKIDTKSSKKAKRATRWSK